ncbi:hypothetical protein FWK35_00022751 [Aphis craccivora]|uniref:Uncharacterized protein n=1 Tax=Aphis craccivora TaxID=307492 RepID=A0A6G0YH84_APHCR|nr:hypothetical protein FWK35_00025261 [Aphis craccivora]KAF0755641.1 hypothetical protein FWK35_00022751 [Aphis craccivora]
MVVFQKLITVNT